MKLYAQLILTGVLAAGGIMTAGCTLEAHGPEVAVGPPPVGYVYEDDYYGRGHWDGRYWAWRDRQGHFYREERAIHDRRIREHVEHDRHDHH